MWFIFPQLRELGESEFSLKYGLVGIAEAKAYLDHEILASRLNLCTDIVLGLAGKTAIEVFGKVDAQKLRSSMTLFELISKNYRKFPLVLDKYYSGKRCPLTLEIVNK